MTPDGTKGVAEADSGTRAFAPGPTTPGPPVGAGAKEDLTAADARGDPDADTEPVEEEPNV